MATLTIVDGKQKGASFDVDPPVKFGRSSETDITISDSRISREHGQIVKEEGIFYLEDLDSSNGTEVNGNSIERVRIKDGDRILAGTTEMAILLDQEEKMAYQDTEEQEVVPDAGQEEEEKEEEEKEEEEGQEEVEKVESGTGSDPSGSVPNSAAADVQTLIPVWVLFLLGIFVIGGVFLASYYLTKMILPVIFK